MSLTATSGATGVPSKTPTKAAAPRVPSTASSMAGIHTTSTPATIPSATSKLQAARPAVSGTTPTLPPRLMKTSVSMDTGKDLQSISVVTAAAQNATTVTSCHVPSVSIAVDEDTSTPSAEQGSTAAAGTIRGPIAAKVSSSVAHFPLTTTVSVGTSDGTSVGTSAPIPRTVGPTPLPRTKRGPSKRAGQIEANKATPRRNFSKINRKGSSHLTDLHRPCLQHSFITEATDVQEMEQGLLHLLDDFHSGNLKAFVKDCSFEKMDNVREQQERLARLHFDLGSQQEAYGTLSEEGQLVAKDHLAKLMMQLQDLSTAMYPL